MNDLRELSRRLVGATLLAALAVVAPLAAADDPAAPAEGVGQAAPADGAPASAQAPTPGGAAAADKASATAGKPTAGAKQGSKANGEFIPSEEISADYAVSFPVDI